MVQLTEREEVRRSGLTEEESGEYKLLMKSKYSGGREEFVLNPEDEARIAELERKMQKYQEEKEQ